MRDLFVAPRNLWRMREALMSLLAGDLFRGTPIHRSLALFKLVYLFACLQFPLRSLAAWRRRRKVIDLGGTDHPAA
ncbi:MAG: hypothetical protein ABL878_02020 [Burkholderiales bacterium]